MTTTYDDAVVVLYQASPNSFVAERKRLSAELKAAGDKTGAVRLGKLARPPLSVWVVNQLWWHARNAFAELLSTAERVRQGDLGATGAHREAAAKLRALAATMLGDAGHAATEGTLRQVTTTLSALAVAGGFDPDPPGALSADRDAPGFEPVAMVAAPSELTSESRAEAERERIEEEARARQRAERQRLEGILRDARHELAARIREVDRIRSALEDAEARVKQARAAIDEVEARLAKLSPA